MFKFTLSHHIAGVQNESSSNWIPLIEYGTSIFFPSIFYSDNTIDQIYYQPIVMFIEIINLE